MKKSKGDDYHHKTTAILDKLHFQNSFTFTPFSYNFYANPQFFKKPKV